jgi:acylphosphatase
VHDDRAITDRPTRTVIARISGRVQGVGFRDWTHRRAGRFKLCGWVRNRSDGTVEALFHGPADGVAEMLELCRQGPPLARVDHVAVASAEPPEDEDFRQLPTA